jgi:hypothetical protein
MIWLVTGNMKVKVEIGNDFHQIAHFSLQLYLIAIGDSSLSLIMHITFENKFMTIKRLKRDIAENIHLDNAYGKPRFPVTAFLWLANGKMVQAPDYKIAVRSTKKSSGKLEP